MLLYGYMQTEEIEKALQTIIESTELKNRELTEISSIDLVTLAVNIEKKFKIRFNLSEITNKNFSSLTKLGELLKSKLNSKSLS